MNNLTETNLSDEMWVAIDEGIITEVNGKKHFPNPGETIFVPRKSTHRLSAIKTGRILEIAFGEFDENDIERFEDDYGRVK